MSNLQGPGYRFVSQIAFAVLCCAAPGLAQPTEQKPAAANPPASVQQTFGLVGADAQRLMEAGTALETSGFDSDLVSSLMHQLLAQGKSTEEVGLYLESLGQYRQLGLSVQEALAIKALAAKDEKVATEAAKKLENEEATQKRFLGLNWSLGIGASYDFSGEPRVQSAKLVAGKVRVDEENRSLARLIYETHYFFRYPQDKTKESGVRSGHGPFFGIQSSDNKLLEAFATGYMFGWRHDPEKSQSFNIGFGAVLDPSVQVLGDGLKDGQALPTGETEIRFKKEDRWGLLLVGSFSF